MLVLGPGDGGRLACSAPALLPLARHAQMKLLEVNMQLRRNHSRQDGWRGGSEKQHLDNPVSRSELVPSEFGFNLVILSRRAFQVGPRESFTHYQMLISLL